MPSLASVPKLLLALWPAFLRFGQRKSVRFCITGLVFLAIFFHLHHDTTRSHHAFLEAPHYDTIVHGDRVDGLPESPYPLTPFPYSPLEDTSQNSEDKAQRNPWLAAVISSAADKERRNLIRTSWMHLYRDVPFDGRFVVSNPGPHFTEAVASENRTFGDMIVLEHIPEDDVTANTVKTLEFYKWLVSQGVRYEFVSKMDTDVWLNARGFWDRFLLPRLASDNETGQLMSLASRTIIGELYYSHTYDLVFPHGAMYTATWDMVAILASLQEKFHVVTGEDMATAILMLKGRQRANFVNFKGTEKFDYDKGDERGDGSAWARARTHPNATYHALAGDEAIAVHQLKKEKLWNRVADCFDEQGIKETPPPSEPEAWRSWTMGWHDFWTSVGMSGQYDSRFQRIPSFLWALHKGDWICDGIWNLGPTKGGFNEHHVADKRLDGERS